MTNNQEFAWGRNKGEPFWIFSKLRSAILGQMPLGYEDDSGFHVGAEPADEKPRFEVPGPEFDNSLN